jgi:hypothetical protein
LIIKTKIGKSFGGCVNYLTGKEKAEILHVEGVSMDNPQQMIEDFNFLRKTNPDLGKAVWHASFSFAPEDKGKVSEQLMKDIAKDYADKFGLEQYAVVKHNDTRHEHFHIVANRVKYDGKTVSDQYCAGRGAEFSKRLEKKYELTPAQEKGKRINLTNEQKLKGADKVKYEIYQAINKELPSCRSIEELQTKLQTHGINTELKTQKTGRVYGVSFAKGAECFKGSEIDKSFGINNLTKTLESIAKRLLGKAIPGLDQVKLIKGIIEKGISGMEMD